MGVEYFMVLFFYIVILVFLVILAVNIIKLLKAKIVLTKKRCKAYDEYAIKVDQIILLLKKLIDKNNN